MAALSAVGLTPHVETLGGIEGQPEGREVSVRFSESQGAAYRVASAGERGQWRLATVTDGRVVAVGRAVDLDDVLRLGVEKRDV